MALSGTSTTLQIDVPSSVDAARWMEGHASPGCRTCNCVGWLEMDVVIGFVTEDGALDVDFATPLLVSTPESAAFQPPIDAQNAGTFSTGALWTTLPGELSPHLQAELRPDATTSGTLWIGFEDTHDDGVSVIGAVPFATWTSKPTRR